MVSSASLYQSQLQYEAKIFLFYCGNISQFVYILNFSSSSSEFKSIVKFLKIKEVKLRHSKSSAVFSFSNPGVFVVIAKL